MTAIVILHPVYTGNSRYWPGQNQWKQLRRFYQIEWLSNVIEMEQHWKSADVPHSGVFLFHVCTRSVIKNTKILILKFLTNDGCSLFLLQPAVWTLIETIFLPYANARLSRGLPLPIIHGFILQNAEIILSTSGLAVCSDVAFADSNKRFLQLNWVHKKSVWLLIMECK